MWEGPQCPDSEKLRGTEAAPTLMLMSREILRTNNFVADAANFIVDLARTSLAERNEFRIALAGGNTPRPVYTEVARIARDFPWDRVLFTFGDERCVPPDNEQSNYRMARESFFE